MGKKGLIKLVLPKNSGSFDVFNEAIMIVANNFGMMDMSQFVSDIDLGNDSLDITSVYHKSVLPRFFGLLLFNKISKKLYLTTLGMAFCAANTIEEKIDVIFDSLATVMFGRHNNAVDSDSDIEAPIVFLKTISKMHSATSMQIGCIIFYMETEKITLEQAIVKVQALDSISEEKERISSEGGNKFFDLKFNVLFEEMGIVEKQDGEYIFSEYVRKNYINEIESFREVNMCEFLAGQDNEYYPKLEDYNPNISTEQWLSILNIHKDKYPDVIMLLKAIYQNGGECDYVSLAKILKKSVLSECIGNCGLLGLKISKALGISVFEKDSVKKYIAVPFQGRVVQASNKPLHYIKLRKPLFEALSNFDWDNLPNLNSEMVDESLRKDNGANILLYGVPGSGKSFTIENELCASVKKENKKRVVFHPEYTYSDFVGQILPKVDKDEESGKDEVTYKFVPGPFTTIMSKAYQNPNEEFVLIIEELNRGNAPAIFGSIFQLLDRINPNSKNSECLPNGTSEYEIYNEDIASEMYGEQNKGRGVRIPSNLTIIATMNTSDQNVFTLDTAFQRRWQMRQIENSFDRVSEKFSKEPILDSKISWRKFCVVINNYIMSSAAEMSSMEDKRLGVFFVLPEDLKASNATYTMSEYYDLCKKESLSDSEKARLKEINEALNIDRKFPEKVIKYLWDDAFKFNRDAIFNKSYHSLDAVIKDFMTESGNGRFKIFQEKVQDKLTGTDPNENV